MILWKKMKMVVMMTSLMIITVMTTMMMMMKMRISHCGDEDDNQKVRLVI